eukprot:123072-Pyramimonas_sp.AAC.1
MGENAQKLTTYTSMLRDLGTLTTFFEKGEGDPKVVDLLGHRVKNVSERMAELIERATSAASSDQVLQALANFSDSGDRDTAVEAIRSCVVALGPIKFNGPNHVNVIADAVESIISFYVQPLKVDDQTQVLQFDLEKPVDLTELCLKVCDLTDASEQAERFGSISRRLSMVSSVWDVVKAFQGLMRLGTPAEQVAHDSGSACYYNLQRA